MERALAEVKDAIKEGTIRNNDIENLKAKIMQYYKHNVDECVAHDLIIHACKCKNISSLHFLLFESDHLQLLKNTRLSEERENMLRIDAFYHALRDDNMEMVRMLYHYWAGGTYWPNQALRVNQQNVHLVTRLHNIIAEAKAKCKLQLISEPNMNVNIHGFITFINYQLNVYKQLENNKKPTPNAVADVTTVLRVYENFKQIEHIRLPKETSNKDEQLALLEISDKSTIRPAMLYHYLNDEYYQELDYYTALFFLDNLHVIKKNYKIEDEKEIVNFYHNIERNIFYYIFCVFEKWQVYVDPKAPIIKQKCVIQNQSTPISIPINLHKLDQAPVLYLERRQFENCLMDLPNLFKDSNYENRNYDNKPMKFDENYLKFHPDLRDYYSLKKAVYYINAVGNDKTANALCILRALMVLGEMTKSTEQSQHLSSTARILLEARISVATMNLVKDIRNNLAKADQGKLNKRIEVIKQNTTIFRDIQMELNVINEHIKSVAAVYECILNESMVQHGINLIDAREKEWTFDAKNHMNYIYQTLDTSLEKAEYNEKAMEGKLQKAEHEAKEMKRKFQLEQLMQDTGLTYNHILEIEGTERNRDILENKLKTLKNRSKSIVKSELPKYMPIIYDKINGMKGLDNKKKTELFESVIVVLEFFSKFDAFEPHHTNQKVKDCIKKIKEDIKTGLNNSAVQCIFDLISTIGNNNPTNYETFKNIEELKKLFISKSYHTDRIEIDELLSDLKYLIGNLQAVLEYNQRPTTKQLLFKYERDQKFRLSFEMLLSDIFNIFSVCGIRHNKLLEKPNKLLTSKSIRNVLAHGDPILELLGDILDSKDLATTLLEKAMAVAEAGATIEALHKLFCQDITAEIINGKKPKSLNSEQNKLLAKFKECDEWQIYLTLIKPKPKKR